MLTHPLQRLAFLASAATALLLSVPAQAAEDFSAAEQAIFMANQLGNVRPPATLRYSFRKGGTLEAGYSDAVSLDLKAQPDGRCCAASGAFLSGARQMQLPPVDDAKGNPVVLYFLEHDIREMNRLTKGSQNYFRKRLRMTIYQGATVKPATFRFKGRDVAGQEITVRPYLDDPNRYRYEKLAGKEYRFLLSDAVPGGVYGISTQVNGEPDGPPLVTEDMLIEGAETASAPRKP